MSLLSGAMQGLGDGMSSFAGKVIDSELEKERLASINEMKIGAETRQDSREERQYQRGRQDKVADDTRGLQEKIAVDSYNREQDGNTPRAKAETGLIEAQIRKADATTAGLNKTTSSKSLKVKSQFTDQETGQLFNLFEDGSSEPVVTQETTKGRGIPYKEGFNDVTKITPVKGVVSQKNGQLTQRDVDMGYSKYLNAMATSFKADKPLTKDEWVTANGFMGERVSSPQLTEQPKAMLDKSIGRGKEIGNMFNFN